MVSLRRVSWPELTCQHCGHRETPGDIAARIMKDGIGEDHPVSRVWPPEKRPHALGRASTLANYELCKFSFSSGYLKRVCFMKSRFYELFKIS